MWVLLLFQLSTIKLFLSPKIADCSTGSVKVYNGKDDSATLMGTFCGANAPTVLTSGDKNLYVVYTSTEASNSFKASWKKVTSKCEIHIYVKMSQKINLKQ